MKRILSIIGLLLIVGCKEDIKRETNNTKEVEVKIEKENKNDRNITEIIPSPYWGETIVYTDEQLRLRQELELYLEQLKTLNTEGILEMTYPKLFIPINKNMFRKYINTLLTSPHIAIASFDTDITDIGEIEQFSSGKFAIVQYRSSIKLVFINPELYSDKLSISVLNDILTSKYGKENIKIDPQNREIVINKEEKLLAINENDNGWKFIGDNSEYRRLYPQIIPLDILSQI